MRLVTIEIKWGNFMRKRSWILAIGSVGTMAALCLIVLPYLFPDPRTEANADLIHVGMGLSEVEAILGEARPSYSSLIDYDYRIWQGRDGWIRVWLVDGKVTRTEFSPGLPMDDDEKFFARYSRRARSFWSGQ